jgi:peptide/nickel transport system permease protein
MGAPPSNEVIAAKRVELGLNRTFIVQFKDWVVNVSKGDLGTSLISKRPVSEEIKLYLPKTLWLTGLTMVLTVIVSIPLGLLTAVYNGTLFDRIIQRICYFMVAWPSFFLALVILYLFAVRFRWFPVSRSEGYVGLVMPVLTLTAGMAGWYTRQVRSVILEQLNEGYVKAMRARGISETTIMIKHVLKNSLNPILALLGTSLGGLLGGAAIIESIFSWEGIGYWAIKAISMRNYPVLLGYVLWMALIFMAINFFVEIARAIIDPRIRQASREK